MIIGLTFQSILVYDRELLMEAVIFKKFCRSKCFPKLCIVENNDIYFFLHRLDDAIFFNPKTIANNNPSREKGEKEDREIEVNENDSTQYPEMYR